MKRTIKLGFAIALAGLGGCSTVFPKPEQPPAKPPTRGELETKLRGELAAQPADPCIRARWMAERAAKASGLEGEVAEELRSAEVHACALQRGGGALADRAPEPVAPPLEPLVFDGACSRAIAEAKLRERAADSAERSQAIDKAAVEDAFATCFSNRIAACQTALDADVTEGVACWRKFDWPEVPAAVAAGDIAATALCLGELQAVVADLRACGNKKASERDACVTPYVGYVPKCGLLDAARAWRSFPGAADVDRVANADAQRRADREAKLAKERADREQRAAAEIARCLGRSTIELATRAATDRTLTKVPGCRYELAGNVLSKNNVYVQLADATGKVVFLVRTREPLASGPVASGRYARFEAVESAELADGSTQRFAVFALEPTK